MDVKAQLEKAKEELNKLLSELKQARERVKYLQLEKKAFEQVLAKFKDTSVVDKLVKKLKRLEFRISTQPLPPKVERELVKKVREIEKELEKYRPLREARRRLPRIEKEIEKLKGKIEEYVKKIKEARERIKELRRKVKEYEKERRKKESTTVSLEEIAIIEEKKKK